MREIQMGGKCPKCNSDVVLSGNVDISLLAPTVRSKIKPIGSINVYRISSEDIKHFIIQKARKYVPDVKIEVVPRYCEKKRRKDSEPRHSYASLRIAFSENIIEKKDDLGWYGKIGDSGNVRVIPSLFENIIAKYQYKHKDIDSWLKSYKSLEELEDNLGMTEAYISDLKRYTTPQRVMTTDKQSWVIFAAAAENVIMDMLTEVSTGKVPGRIQIMDVYPI